MIKIEFLKTAIKLNASDIHLSENSNIIYRINGELVKSDVIFSAEDMSEFYKKITTAEHYNFFNEYGEVNFAYQDEHGRYRINVYKDINGMAMAMRVITNHLQRFENYNFPNVLKELALLKKGLVLITGSAGAGKSTTLAAMVDYINANFAKHIITLEDPIEYIHKSKKSLINQREINTHSKSFLTGLNNALREDPDIILIGELRDTDSIETALQAAETGHLILGTLHTCGAAQTIDRMIDIFPDYRQNEIRSLLAFNLKCVLSQQLFKRKDGNGRIAAFEIMLNNIAIQNLIREGKTHNIIQTIQTSSMQGMKTMGKAINELKEKNLIE